MPAAQIAPGCSSTPFFQKPYTADESQDSMTILRSPESMSGAMTLIGPGNHMQSVQVKVYRTSCEHFAVIYPQKKVCRPLGVMNIKNIILERLENGFKIRQKGFDSPLCFTFISETPKELNLWVDAFTCCSTGTLSSCTLPILEEDEE
uniref:PH domain-containing protein n=1 Tax=Cacopsylla melanoneura TaxID=428564 RepID=A0A8D8S091_9HEMI